MSKVYDTTSRLTYPNDLNDSARTKVAQAINPIVADVFAIYIKTKNFHWHMSGSHFRDYHLLLDEQAEQIYAMIDVLAERVRKLGKNTIRSVGEIAKLKKVQDNDKDFVEPKDMIHELMNDNKNLTQHMRAAHAVCDAANDIATASLLENFIDETERRTWFLLETQVD